MPDNRTLSEEDIEAIASALQRKLSNDFYMNLGKGFWGLICRGLLIGAAAVAAYGAIKSL